MQASIESTGLFGSKLSAHSLPPIQRRGVSSAGELGFRRRCRILRRGEHLFRTGDRVDRVYRTVGGILKSYVMHVDGDEQVIGFHLPGDLIGIDTLADECAAFSVVALNTSSVQSIAVARDGSTVQSKAHQKMMLCWMQDEILRMAHLLHMERAGTDERLARFLLDFSAAQQQRGYSANEFHLPMGRKDLARYIGMSPETLSRIFGRLRAAGVLEVENNHIVILDADKLRALSRKARQP